MARLELLIKLVFEEVAVVVTVNIATAASVIPTSTLVESSSVIVTLSGSVRTGPDARAAKPPKTSIMKTIVRRTNLLACKRPSAPAL